MMRARRVNLQSGEASKGLNMKIIKRNHNYDGFFSISNFTFEAILENLNSQFKLIL